MLMAESLRFWVVSQFKGVLIMKLRNVVLAVFAFVVLAGSVVPANAMRHHHRHHHHHQR